MTSILMPWPDKLLSPNARVHWARKSKCKRSQKDIWYLKSFYAYGINGATKFRMTFHPPDKRKRDIDNIIASTKNGIDGLALAAGVDDSQFRIEWPTELSEPVKGGQILVEILP